MQKVVISILHYDSSKDTEECIESLYKADLKNINITTIVLDNASKNGLKLDIEKYEKLGLKVFESDTNIGFTGGHNLVYEKVKGIDFAYFLLLNNDTLVDKNFLQELLTSSGKENIGAVVPKIYFTKGKEYHSNRYKESEKGKVIWYAGGSMDWANVMSQHIGVDEVDSGQFDEAKEIDFATGACLLLKKEVIEKIDLFDNRYFLYYEDADLCQRIIKNGFKILYQPKAIVWHNNAGSSGSGSELHDYYLTRNRLLFGMKFAPIIIKGFLFKESIRLLINGRKWQKIGVRDYYLKNFGKGSFG